MGLEGYVGLGQVRTDAVGSSQWGVHSRMYQGNGYLLTYFLRCKEGRNIEEEGREGGRGINHAMLALPLQAILRT